MKVRPRSWSFDLHLHFNFHRTSPIRKLKENQPRKMKLIFRILFCLLFINTLHAQQEFFVIKNYDVQIEVNKDAYFDVIETIEVEFSEKRRGIFRNIPYRFTKDGQEVKIKIKHVKVDNWKFKKSNDNGMMNIRIGSKSKYIEGRQEYVIRYRVYDAFIWAEEHTEFYWNMTGNQWNVPIENFAYAITFPEGISLRQNDYRVFTGAFGEGGEDATASYRGQNLYGKSKRQLNPKEGVTIATKLPKGSIINKAGGMKADGTQKSFWEKNNLLGIPTALIVFFSWFWFKMGRNPKIKSSEEAIYYPPQGYSPAEMGTLIDNQANNHDIISLLPWWAEQGHISIRNRPTESEEGLNMRLERLKDLPADAPTYQQTVFRKLFREKDVVYLNEFTNVFYTSMGEAKSQIKKILKEHELYDRSSYRIFHSGWMIAAFVVCVGLGVFLMTIGGQPLAGIIMMVFGFLAFVSHFLSPKLSDYGRDLMSQLHNFRETIKNPDRETISDILKKDPKYFEYIFPYAIAFGLEKNWLKQTDGLFSAPLWYGYYGTGYNDGQMGHQQASFQSFTEGFQPREIQEVFTSSPVPQSGSGGFSGGGGSSGGGFGGGGGGSW